MELLAEQEYVKIERKVDSLEQVDLEHWRYLRLYKSKITSEHREFPIQEVLDMSFREIGSKGVGLLYLHTIRGVYSYTVKSSPKQFIETYKRHVGKNV
ncbi:hypothetical protein [Ornithinibacillus bavariensis]|uniref:Uncharacterized protein n=1 Tax=Ornithinibacillus bavariensis TaxID=545502 RepID=A0A919X6U9_9BACI|nr:hypothetical protein [Ornithinibacillus bavariensis]GIO26611.1 hypothetical protein J43TS3_12220 [Ornithinibacillus bavariensis]